MILISLGVRRESVATGVTGRPKRGEADLGPYDSTESTDSREVLSDDVDVVLLF